MKTLKNILSYAAVSIAAFTLISSPLFGLAYTSQTNGEEMHRRSCNDTFQATGQVCAVFEDGTRYCGTATLIGPDVIITAAHVFKSNSRVVSVSFYPSCEASSAFGHKSKNIWMHPNYNPETGANDIAIVQLASPLNNIRPAELQKTLPSYFDSVSATVVGYGAHGIKVGKDKEGLSQNPQISDGKRRAGDIDIYPYVIRGSEGINIYEYLKTGSSMFYSSMHHFNDDGNYIRTPKDSKYKAFLAPGDSGGPAFIKVNGETYSRIIGINVGLHSYISVMPGTESVDHFMSIPYYYEWIKSKLKLCGASPYNENSQQLVVMDYNKNSFGYLADYVPSLTPFLDSLYDYLPSVEYPDLNSIALSISEKGSALFDEYITAHKELYDSLWD